MNHFDSKKEYIKRINNVQDYIEDNLYHNLTLEELSDIAGFSKYHFHRIFKGVSKESLFHYVTRNKLERVRSTLIARPDLSITDVAYKFGFTDSAIFSRTFKNYYKISPKAFREQYSNNCKDHDKSYLYNESIINNKELDSLQSKENHVKGIVEVLTIDTIPVIYVRQTGAYTQLEDTFSSLIQKLFNFALEENIIDFDKSKLLTIYHSHPDFSEEQNQRTSICLSIQSDINITENQDGIGYMLIPAGKYAVGHFEIDQSEYSDAWDYLYGDWLPQSGYLPRDSFPFEVYVSDPNSDPLRKHIVDIYLPIEPF